MDLQPQDIPDAHEQGTLKSKLGQYYTYNSDYILQGLSIPKGSTLIEPFAGDKQLCLWCEGKGFSNIECYDIDPKAAGVVQRDTLKEPPNYKNKFVVTNPPYLARNKTSDKTIFDLYKTNDLYKCFISSMIQGEVLGGVIIVPLNFFCDSNCTDVRDRFLSNYNVEKLNIFEEEVFEDTSYTVCSFQFHKSAKENTELEIDTTIFPRKENVTLSVEKEHGWKVAGELDKKVENKYSVSRLVRPAGLTKIYLYGIDSGGPDGRIRLELKDEPFLGKDTDRAFATLIVEPAIPMEIQEKVVERFNLEIESLRAKHNSLFLVNYRNSTKSYARKRIKFAMVYNMVKKITNEVEEEMIKEMKGREEHLKTQLENLTDRVEWLEAQIQEHEMSSEVIWFINSRYKAKFFNEEEE